ncbi:membrane lipoprotein lipid attachment site-containing protein [Gramella sp. AN32]|uniref:Membrane lipoprotein lipid attachment site-containing protein n=1 Tax=Christiangramia antarctica TaxID=2058158 RepID=A0ABW5X1A4_9FLAO|nr:membrane lipoprotein lipid attachment site-containing protein [Gramella sp. AN32]MCM4155057.1 hypothetical protein [Gramella sp. AN32]
MKKLVFLFVAVLALVSCSIDDDSPNLEYSFAPIVSNDFPESFDLNTSYDVSLGYNLPACSQFTDLSFNVVEPTSENGNFKEVFIGVVVQKNPAINCTDTEVELKSVPLTVNLNSTDTEDYKFKLLVGVDENDEPIYDEVIVPVNAAD